MRSDILSEVTMFYKNIESKKIFLNYSKLLIDKLHEVFSNQNLELSDEDKGQISNYCFINRAFNLFIRDTYLVSSYAYYVKESYLELQKESIEIDKLEDYFTNIYKSWSNIIYSMYEEIMRRKYEYEKWDFALFEASPKDQDDCEFVQEIHDIRILAMGNDSLYHPIVRYATNSNILEKTINNHEIKCYHFSCHGAPGEIAILDDGNQSYRMTSSKFLSYFENRSDDVFLVYVNVCNSNDFSRKLREYSGSTNFMETIGFTNSIFDNEALIFSKMFYEVYLTKEDHLVEPVIGDIKERFSRIYGESEYIRDLSVR